MTIREVTLEDVLAPISLADVPSSTLVLARKKGVITGAVVLEQGRWIVKISGGNCGCSGHHETREEAIRSAAEYGYTFFIDEPSA